MVVFSRADLSLVPVDRCGGGVFLKRTGKPDLWLDRRELYWLTVVAGPAALASLGPEPDRRDA